MNRKERFQAACEHRTADRVPIDYHAAGPEIEECLKRHYGAATEVELLDALGCDFYYLSCRDISQNESCLPIYRVPRLPQSEKTRICPFGIGWSRGAYASKFRVDDVLSSPLAHATSPQDILRYAWPKPEWFDLEPLAAECETQANRVIVGGFWSGIFGDSYRMMGFETFLLNMAERPDLIKTLVDRMTEFYLELNERAFCALKGKLNVFYFGNDYGTQAGLIFSRAMWADFFFENTRRLAELGHRHGLKVMMHSCGAVAELIPLLIQAGVDILDPVQVAAQGMEAAALKAQYGNEIVFHGGVDAQKTLRTGTPEEVRRHVLETIRVLGRDGGYIFAPSQGLQPDMPVPNIVAMYEAALQGCPPEAVNRLTTKEVRR